MLVFDNARLREVAAAAPYEFIEVVVNDRKYGGGGIFNQYATVAADHAFTPYVFVHEFGHHFAGLADEYYTSDVAYESPKGRPEPWEKNVTADPRRVEMEGPAHARRGPADTVAEGGVRGSMQADIQARRREVRARQLPEQQMEALFRDERSRRPGCSGRAPTPGKVGAFEGAMYEAQGYYRPQADCIMFTRDEVGFCAVCRRAIEQVIALYAR